MLPEIFQIDYVETIDDVIDLTLQKQDINTVIYFNGFVPLSASTDLNPTNKIVATVYVDIKEINGLVRKSRMHFEVDALKNKNRQFSRY